jgi:ADP-ribosyl-[dinitrogen reductase] hydrolase
MPKERKSAGAGGAAEKSKGAAPKVPVIDLSCPEQHCWMNVSAAQTAKGGPLTSAELQRIYNGRDWNAQRDARERIRGGVLGLLVGDAIGVPYEFKPASALPRLEEIGHGLPAGFGRAHPNAPADAWSDDGAQALCLLASLLHRQKLDPDDLARRIVSWYQRGYMAVDEVVFDVGVQTSGVLRAMAAGRHWSDVVATDDDRLNGNGALMRVLPLALWHAGSDAELVHDARLQSRVTHGHIRSQLCCALYCLWARRLLEARSEAFAEATDALYEIVSAEPEALVELDHQIRPRGTFKAEGKAYVVDTLHVAMIAMKEDSYERVVQRAIAFGQDTDTTAAVAGGLAGIRDGVSAIPYKWRLNASGQRLIEPMLEALLERRVGEMG